MAAGGPLSREELSEMLKGYGGVQLSFLHAVNTRLPSRHLGATLRAVSQCPSITRLDFRTQFVLSENIDFSGLLKCVSVREVCVTGLLSPGSFRSLVKSLSPSVRTLYLRFLEGTPGHELEASTDALLDALRGSSIACLGINAGCYSDEKLLPLVRVMMGLGLEILDLDRMNANNIRAITKMVKEVSAPVPQVLVRNDTAPRLVAALNAAVQKKNAPSLIMQLELVMTSSETFDLIARRLSGVVAASLPCTPQSPRSQEVPKLITECVALPASDHNLKLLLPDGQLLKEDGRPVIRQFRRGEKRPGTIDGSVKKRRRCGKKQECCSNGHIVQS
jgi:hypothetical protein